MDEPLNEEDLKEAKKTFAYVIYQLAHWTPPSPAEVANVLDKVPNNLSVYKINGELVPLIEYLVDLMYSISASQVIQAIRYLIENRFYDDNLDAAERALFSFDATNGIFFDDKGPEVLYLLSDYLYGNGRNLEARNTKGLTIFLHFAKERSASEGGALTRLVFK